MSKTGWCITIVGVVVFAFIMFAFTNYSSPHARITKIGDDGTIWIHVQNISGNTSFYLYWDDIEEGKYLRLAK